MPVCVVDATEAAALDAAAIAGGVPSRALMRAAAFNAATVICARFADELHAGVTIFTGAGNNGGDGWALATALDAAGVAVAVREVVTSHTPDATAERALAIRLCTSAPLSGGVIIDAMLGTGNSGALRGAILDAAREIAAARTRGTVVVALDLPSGVDPSNGVADASDPGGQTSTAVSADLTISFGSCKRGSLISRAQCGEIVVVDIGLGSARQPSLPTLVDPAFVRANVPKIAPDAHKGTRRSVAVIAGAENMGGAAILAATAALRSGVGLVQVITAPANVSAIHTQIPEALVAPLQKAAETIEKSADAVLIGPGLDTGDATRAFVRDLLQRWRGPMVADAGALSAFDGDLAALGNLLCGRPAIITPHPGEMARLVGKDIAFVLRNRFDIGLDVARTLGAAVLLKGTPTVISSPGGTRFVIASGTPALATGGSGDALSGMVVTLLAQGCAPEVAAACAAWVHGRAAELVPGVRGYRLLDIVDRLPDAWSLGGVSTPLYPRLAALPTVV